MLKPIHHIEDEQGLMFVIEGRDWNLYKADSDLNEIKDEFIKCHADREYDCKYIGLTNSNDTSYIDTIVCTFKNRFIIEDEALVDKCIFPIKAKELSNMISALADHYRNLGYEIIVKRGLISG